MSREVEERIAARIDPPYVDPYGNPIPGLAELGITESDVTSEGKDLPSPPLPLPEAITEAAPGRVRLERIGERVQSDPRLLEELAGHGIVPGAEVSAERIADSFVLRGETGGEVAILAVAAGQLHVTPVTAG